ncbi:MAG TPA: M23 family metallopeptidase [Gammaproteobacteria bacterium]|nr:M23 family metallopeptidase [Gammaproteobacteria bacterium]
MNILFFTKKRGGSNLVVLSTVRVAVLALGALVVLPAVFLYAGYQLGLSESALSPTDLEVAIQTELDEQQLVVAEAARTAQENINALALRLGKLQAHVMRIDALGQRLTKMAKLETGEFDFEHAPAQGGPLETEGIAMSVPDFLKSLDELSAQLEDRGKQMAVLETMMMSRNLQAEVMPAGRPVNRGWLSSYYGLRTDPFSGRRVHHSGVDFAGRLGSDVVSVAAGVVTFAGKRSGYGNLVEINHGNGYVTRYGHSRKILVKVGDTVKKGQVIAEMGTTGRSTGPHVHFEVLLNGRAVNPKRYVMSVPR